MTVFTNTVEYRIEAPRTASPDLARGAEPAARRSNDPDRVAIQRKLESGLDRLLRDIEKFEEVERWDGMS